MDANEYKQILAEDGRRVANRVAYAAFGNDATPSLNSFYAMYGDEKVLPVCERSRADNLANAFDPTGWNRLYALDSVQSYIGSAARAEGTTRDWVAELDDATPEQRKYFRELFFNEEARRDADEQWSALLESINRIDDFVLFVLFTGRWPKTDGAIHELLPGEVEIATNLSSRD